MERTFDAVILGAGFGGLYQLKRLGDMGLNVLAIDRASGVGGTWYWNQYPGIMSDTESYLYRYSWDKEDLRSYPWSHHYVQGHEVLRYLEHVADKYSLRKHIQLETTLESAEWIQSEGLWSFTTSQGPLKSRYFIGAPGLLTVPIYPDIPGRDTFKGTLCHSSRWPRDLDCSNKRVGVIGCGSTGIQIITALAPKVKGLTCFQRNPQYSVPSGNRSVTAEYRQWVNENYDKILADLKKSSTCFGVPEVDTPYASKCEEDRDAIFEALWKQGNGFRFMFSGFGDITTNKEANEGACNFIRKKIAEIVNDPVKARKLQPTQPYARRPLCDSGYYQQFNRENVDVVSLKETPMTEITADGIKTSDGKLYELNVIIFATGFDAIDGAYNAITIRGNEGETLRERWARDGPVSYLGMSVSGFPNFFMITGPQGPFTNLPPAIETHVDFVSTLILAAETARSATNRDCVVEPCAEAQRAWVDKCEKLAEGSMFRETKSWIFGANVEGKKSAVRYYFGGMKAYLEEIEEVKRAGLRGFRPLEEEQVVDKSGVMVTQLVKELGAI